MRAKTEIELFYVNVLEQPNGCLFWTATKTGHGYGQLTFRGKRRLAHHVALLLHGKEIDRSLDVDHVCHNRDKSCYGGDECQHRRCVRIDHLQQVSRSVNLLQGVRKDRYFQARHPGHEIVQGKYQRRPSSCGIIGTGPMLRCEGITLWFGGT